MTTHSAHNSRRAILPAARPARTSSLDGWLVGVPTKTRVSQACHGCRKAKIKCDGKRPTCGPCESRDNSCIYEEGRTRHLATKSRLESLEKLVAALKISTPEEADRLLQRVRTSDNVTGVLDEKDDSIGSDETSSYPQGNSETPSVGSREGTEASSNVANLDLQSPLSAHSAHGGISHRDSTSVPKPGALAPNCSSDAIRLLLPDEDLTRQAVESFFRCSGKLFHAFPSEHVWTFFETAYHGHDELGEKGKIPICFLMAVSAVGAQYVHDDFDESIERTFYDIARHCSETVTQYQPLDSIKVSALLALYNILEKDTLSLGYVETGLGMCRRYELSSGKTRPSYMSNAQWIDYRRTWRTLMFFSSWLSATLGYISGNDVMADRIAMSEVAIADSSDLSEIVQTQMTKICLLKASMLRMHLTLRELTVERVELMLHDLQKWHKELPDPIRLNCTGRDGFTAEAKRSIFHVHLLYLGAIMLLYRRIASEVARPYSFGKRGRVLPADLEDVVAKVGGEAVLAARTSARILKLMLEDNGMFKRCWLVIFQAYTSCIIMLHSAAQKQLHNLHPSTLKDDMEGVGSFLDVLEFCASSDRVASKFRKQLCAIFGKVQEAENTRIEFGDVNQMEIDFPSAVKKDTFASLDEIPGDRDLGNFNYLLTLPENANTQRTDFCLSLIYMISRPFIDPYESATPDGGATASPQPQESPIQTMGTVESLAWDAEKNVQLNSKTDLTSPSFALVTGEFESPDLDYQMMDGNHSWFVGSTSPSGWTEAISTA